jgi:HD-GYP domain-containing protein (c-di-GMP phosphodiesterase class II)
MAAGRPSPSKGRALGFEHFCPLGQAVARRIAGDDLSLPDEAPLPSGLAFRLETGLGSCQDPSCLCDVLTGQPDEGTARTGPPWATPPRFAGLLSLLRVRDAFTREHSDEVGGLMGAMVRETGAGPLEVEWAVLGGRLHDIGKLAVRYAVLLKQGPLSRTERLRLRLHTVIGSRILEAVAGPGDLAVIALHHHERFDGKGYPYGLKGAEIPFAARLAAVADTFQALTANRPYRRGMSRDRALAVVFRLQGSQLCPECVELLGRVAEQRPELLGPARLHP